MTILAMRTAIVERLQETFPTLADHIKSTFRTKISTADADHCLTNTNIAMHVAFAGVLEDAMLVDDELQAPETWVIYILTKDGTGKNGVKRDVSLLTILPKLLLTICQDGFELEDEPEGSDFGETTNFRPKGVRSAPVYEGEPDESVSSCLIWAVRFTETALIGPPTPADATALVLVTHYDLAPGDGEDEASDTYPKPPAPEPEPEPDP